LTRSEPASGPSTPSTAPDRSPVKVLFIAGLGRSGSTILDNVLGQLDGFFSAGELRLSWYAPMLADRFCGCGSPLTDCSIWSRVLPYDPAAIAATRIRYFRYPDKPRHWLLFFLGLAAHPSPREAERIQNRYRELRQVSGARVIVDSSKKPAYAHVLAATPGIDLYVLHLIRDPRGVAHSWSKQVAQAGQRGTALMKRQRAMSTALRWNLVNRSVERNGAWSSDRYHRLHYERFVENPASEVESIVNWLGEGSDPTGPFVTEHKVRLAPTHTVWGNPSRFRTGEVELRADEAWRREMKPGRRRIVTWLTRPLLRRYGYAL
jgi:hypothetical protein